MDIRKIKKLLDLMNEADVTEIEIREGEESLRISRPTPQHGNFATSSSYSAAVPTEAGMPTASAGNSSLEKRAEKETPSADEGSSHIIIKSPMVGTLYLAPGPDSEPFVQVGKSVKKGDTLCIVEAMKMFNQIEAEQSGIIVKSHLENGSPVEFDQPLFELRPA